MTHSAVTLAVALLVVPFASTAATSAQGSRQTEVELARQSYAGTEYETARDRLNTLIAGFASLLPTPEERRLVMSAYELRGRARFNLRDRDGARADFSQLLANDADHQIASDASPAERELFESVRAAIVGSVTIVVTPADAALVLDDTRPVQAGGTALRLIAGPHTISANRADHAPVSRWPFRVEPGTTTPVVLNLERLSSTVEFVTVPAGVEVLIDDVVQGTTAPAAGSAPLGEGRLTLAGVGPGVHKIEYRRGCYNAPPPSQLDTTKPADYRQPRATLTLAEAELAISVSGTRTTEASVRIDGRVDGVVPKAVKLCEGMHTVEVRSRSGRDVRRFDLKAGQRADFQAGLKPAFAMASDSGMQGAREVESLGLEIENLFRQSTIGVFVPDETSIHGLLRSFQPAPPADWLAFNPAGRAVGGAMRITSEERRSIGSAIARGLEAQGVLAVTFDPDGDLVLMLLAPGSATPDIIKWRRDASESVRTLLGDVPPPMRRSIGLATVDVIDRNVPAVVVAGVEAGLAEHGIQVGDAIMSAGGTAVESAAQLERVVETRPPGTLLPLDVRSSAGVPRRVEIKVEAVPNVISPDDRSLLSNKLAADYAFRLDQPGSPEEEISLRLNLAAARVRLTDWAGASEELGLVPGLVARGQLAKPLADRIGGTRLYLLGRAAEGNRDLASAQAFYAQAAQLPGTFLSQDGALLKELARQRLDQLPAAAGAPRR